MSSVELHPVVLYNIVNSLGWPTLRPLQEQSIEPIMAGSDTLLIAPTAGGKTEAAIFPVLSAMTSRGWGSPSVLYLCPLRALLNNLEPRLDAYAKWVGRRAALWHGDTADSKRRRMLIDSPDLLLTTPESLESMLVSTRVTPRELFADLQLVVVDEVHAFAGDDRGWHLLAVLERLQRLAGRPLQRIGLSATIGNPDELLRWLQGSGSGHRQANVVGVEVAQTDGCPAGDVTLDHVGSVENAATVISSLHAGEKRLTFCESRRTVEDLALALRERGVQTFVSHSSLSRDERHRAEQAFAETRDCVIVSTSTLELGIDVGDLDRVVQVDSPRTVASFLQRMGRSGRRPGSTRNALLLTTHEQALLQASAVLHLWSSGYVEAITAPPSPRHIAAQQLLALCLQEGHVGEHTWPEWWSGLPLHDDAMTEVLDWLVESQHLQRDNGMLFIGPEAERRYGRKNFLDLLSVFTASPEFVVLQGRNELGSVDPIVLTRKVEGARVVVLAGRSWTVTYIDWKRRRCFVEPSDARAQMRWSGVTTPLPFELCRAERDVLLGHDPDVTLSRRAVEALVALREERRNVVTEGGTVVSRDGDLWWWTWAGARANATMVAALGDVVDPDSRYNNHRIRLRVNLAQHELETSTQALSDLSAALPEVSDEAVRGLKFADVLPSTRARETVALRLADRPHASQVLGEPRRWVNFQSSRQS